jgi:protoporphyrinogen oxidase
MHPPKLEEVVQGALQLHFDGEFHYLKRFRYPSSGGYQSFMREMAHLDQIELDTKVVSVDPAAKTLSLGDAAPVAYDNLVSTMPLPDLVASIVAAPVEVREAAEMLLCTSVVLVDVAVDRDDLSDHHWLYVYDDDVSFSRAHFPHMLSAGNAPVGRGSVQCEIYYSRHRSLPDAVETLADRVVDELIKLEILESGDEVLFTKTRDVRYANVVFDHDRQPALDVILPWVESQGIVLAGRFGEWGYHWTDDATRSGWAAADLILGRNEA